MDFKKPVEFMSEIRKTEHFYRNFGTFPAVLAIFFNFKRKKWSFKQSL